MRIIVSRDLRARARLQPAPSHVYIGCAAAQGNESRRGFCTLVLFSHSQLSKNNGGSPSNLLVSYNYFRCSRYRLSAVACLSLYNISAEILVDPKSRVVYLDQSAEFTCETVGGSLVWTVNGTQREVHPAEIRRDLVVSETITDDGSILENLTIPARAEYNETRVQCFVGIFGGSTAQSDNAILWIQGIDLSHNIVWNKKCTTYLSQVPHHQLPICKPLAMVVQ